MARTEDDERLCNRSLAEWKAWRDAEIDRLLAPSSAEDGSEFLEIDAVGGRAQEIYRRISGCERRRPELFAPGAPREELLRNLKKFTGAVRLVADPDHNAGFTITNQQYLDYGRKEIELPELLRGQAFLNAMRRPDGYRQAYEMIERMNALKPPEERWIVLLYKSRFLKTPDAATYGRFFIYVPGEPEKWIQFGIITPDMSEIPMHAFSMVSVRSRGEATPWSESYIIDYWREYYKGGRIAVKTRDEAGEGTQNCYHCHKTPVIPIHPAEEYTFNKEGSLVAKTEGAGEIPVRLNRLIREYGPPHFGGYLDPEAWGPSIGPVGRQRTDAFFEKTTAGLGLGPASFERIRKHMNCTNCHNMRKIAPLNYPLAARTDVDFIDLRHPDTGAEMPIIKTFIENGWMPPRNALTPQERKGLYRSLRAEYHDFGTKTGLLVEWLKRPGGAS